MGFTGTQVPQTHDVAQVASTTDAIVEEISSNASSTNPKSIAQAYELGKAIGRLQEKTEQVNNKATSTMQEKTDAPISTAPDTTPSPMPESSPKEEVVPTTPVSKARLEIVSPLPGKGLGREYLAAPEVVDESNYIELGAILYGEDGEPVSDQEVRVSVTGEGILVAKRMKGTGNVMNTYKDGQRITVPVYPYHYEFKTAGDHEIVFETLDGLSASVTLTAK